MSEHSDTAATTGLAVIIYGPPGSGKTAHAEALRKHFGKASIVDGWMPGDPLRPDSLVLTNEPVEGAIEITEALRLAGLIKAENAKSGTDQEMQQKLDDEHRFFDELSIASYRLAKAAENAIGAAILALPRDLWPYFTIGDGESAVKYTKLADDRLEELAALEKRARRAAA